MRTDLVVLESRDGTSHFRPKGGGGEVGVRVLCGRVVSWDFLTYGTKVSCPECQALSGAGGGAALLLPTPPENAYIEIDCTIRRGVSLTRKDFRSDDEWARAYQAAVSGTDDYEWDDLCDMPTNNEWLEIDGINAREYVQRKSA